MNAVAELFDVEYGFWYEYKFHWAYEDEGLEFYWVEGNMACDCNRSAVMGSDTNRCGDDRFELLSLKLNGEEVL